MVKRILFVLFFFIPLIEITIFIMVGKWVGATLTILMSVATSLLGFFLVRYEGIQTFRFVNVQLQNGQIPGKALLEGLCIVIGGYLLIIPGFLTDFIGLVCILPFTRNFFLFWFLIWLEKKIAGRYVSRR